MGVLDKLFVKDYEDYRKFIEWAENKVYECPNGSVIRVVDFIYSEWTEKDFKENDGVYFASTSKELDYFLIKDCPFEFVQEWLRFVYDEYYIKAVLSGTSNFDKFSLEDYTFGGKVFVTYPNKTRKMNRPSKHRFSDGEIVKSFTIASARIGLKNLKYDYNINRLLLPNELGDGGYDWLGRIGKIRSVKALVRRFRKMNLPKGSFINVYDVYGKCFTLNIY